MAHCAHACRDSPRINFSSAVFTATAANPSEKLFPSAYSGLTTTVPFESMNPYPEPSLHSQGQAFRELSGPDKTAADDQRSRAINESVLATGYPIDAVVYHFDLNGSQTF
jgi:hypothetical protein